MSDVVVRIDIADSRSESKLFEAVDRFALKQSRKKLTASDEAEAPVIMIKTVPDGNLTRKSVIFQDQASADEFLFFWSRLRSAS